MKDIKKVIAYILLIVMLISFAGCAGKHGNNITLSPDKTLAPLEETEVPEETDEVTEPPVSGELISNELDGMTEREKVLFLASEIDKFTYTERYEKFRMNASLAGNDFGTTDVNYKYSNSRVINEINIGKDSYIRHSDLSSKEEGELYDEEYYFTYKQTDGYINGYMYTSYDPMRNSPYNSVSLKSPISLDDYRKYIADYPDGFPLFDVDKEYAGASVSVVPHITGTKWVIMYEFADEIPAEIEAHVTSVTKNNFTRFFPEKVTAEITVDILTHAIEQIKCNAVYKTAKDTGESLTLTLELSSQISDKAKKNVSYTPTDFDLYTLTDDIRYISYTIKDLHKLFYCFGNNSFQIKDTIKSTKNGVFQHESTYSDTVSYGIKNGYFVFLIDGHTRYMQSDTYYASADYVIKYNGKSFSESVEGKTTEEDTTEQDARYYISSVFNSTYLTSDEVKSVKVTKKDNGEAEVELELFFYDIRDYIYDYLGFTPKAFEIVNETLTLKITFDEGDKMKNLTYILLGEYKRDEAVIKFSQNTTISDIKEADISRIPVFTHDAEL